MESNQQWKITKSKFVAVTDFPDSDDNDNIFFLKLKFTFRWILEIGSMQFNVFDCILLNPFGGRKWFTH